MSDVPRAVSLAELQRLVAAVGERFVELAKGFAEGVGIDIDPAMIEAARSDCPESLTALPLDGVAAGPYGYATTEHAEILVVRKAG